MNKQSPRANAVPVIHASPKARDAARRPALVDANRLRLVEREPQPAIDADRDRSDVPRSRPLFI